MTLRVIIQRVLKIGVRHPLKAPPGTASFCHQPSAITTKCPKGFARAEHRLAQHERTQPETLPDERALFKAERHAAHQLRNDLRLRRVTVEQS